MDRPAWEAPDHEFGSSDELLAAYSSGFVGAPLDAGEMQGLLATLEQPYFSQAGLATAGAGEGKVSLLYRPVLEFDPDAYSERQTTGDCTSHGARNAGDATRASEIVAGELEEFIRRSATEGIYGYRGYGGQGMSPSRAGKFLAEGGGFLLRQKYDFADLSKYNGSLGAKWGSQGLPPALIEEAKKHQARTVALVRTVEEARDAIGSGYGVFVGSNFGFSDKRDADGFAAPRGNWGHCMAWLACDDASKRRGFLVQNSWYLWNDGPKRHDQPDGSFWIEYSVAKAMLAQGGALAVSSVNGFPRRQLRDWGTASFL